MATLEDKLLGEKLEYYCSSSEGEHENEDEQLAYSSKGDSKRETAKDKCLSLSSPPQPSGGYRYQSSSNTGPKGVVEDWQRFKQLQTEKREENERQRLELAKKLTMSTTTAQEDAERKRQEEIDKELAELMSEDFLQQYQKQRMAEMLNKCSQQEQFGKVYNLATNTEFLDCVDKANKNTTIIVHIYDKNLPACKLMNECLDTLAKEYPATKFVKILITVACMSRDFRSKGLPALLIYKAQVVIGNFVRVTDDLSDDFYPSDVESFLIENGILIDKQMYN